MNLIRTFLRTCVPLVLAGLQLTAAAEDIDLFKQDSSSSSATAPNVLFIIDNTANFGSNAAGTTDHTCTIAGSTNRLNGKVGGIEQCALYNVINGLTAASTDAEVSFNIGIMMFNDSGNVTSWDNKKCATLGATVNNTGGCLVYPIVPFTTANKATLLTYIAEWNTSNSGGGKRIDGSSGNAAGSLQESWAYMTGTKGLSGRSYTGATPSTTNCKNFFIYIGNSWSNSGGAEDKGDAEAALKGTISDSAMRAKDPATGQGPTTAYTTIVTGADRSTTTSCGTVDVPSGTTHNSKGFFFDEWARWMKSTSLKVTTFTIGLVNKPSGCKPDYPWLLYGAADLSGGKYFEVNTYATLVDGLQTILSEVRSVNTVFAAVSLPVSVNTQGTFLNQVFIGMFRPDQYFFPRWTGNLKQYKLGYDAGGKLTMQDADGATAISSGGSEFIAECGRSFWTPAATPGGDGYFSTYTTANCTTYPASSNSPDGNIVEKGGAAYRLRTKDHAARTVKTCASTIASCQTAMTDFHTSNAALTATTLGIGSLTTPTKDNLVNWVRGSNNQTPAETAEDSSGALLDAADMRPSSHGDVVHSRPAAFNMGTDAAPKIVLFYGGNDGMLRAVNGNRTTSFTISGTSIAAGDEFWSFVPPEFHNKLTRLYLNNSGIDAGSPKDYAMDGPITVYRDASDNAWLYVGMRRGGRALYAFHMDKATMAITLKWKIGCATSDLTDNSNCSATASFGDYTNMGQTWAPPVVVKARGHANPVLIFGGGYDKSCEDQSYYTCTSTRGNQLYVVDAITGVLQKGMTTQRGVVSDVTTVTDSDGYAKIIYFGDLGGNLYRVTGNTASTYIESNAPSTWTMTRIASVGCDTLAGCGASTATRKFMFSPDVVSETADEYILLLGSGDREKPTKTDPYTTSTIPKANNHFFMVKDYPKVSDWLTQDATGTKCLPGATMMCLKSLVEITQGTTPSDTALSAAKGWYLKMNTQYEQVVTGAIAAFGTVYFGTHEPQDTSVSACVPNLGKSRAYAIRYKNASAAATTGDLFVSRDDSGLSPDLVIGKVTLDNGSTIPVCIGCEGGITPNVLNPGSSITNPAKIRSYWYIQK